MPLQTFSSPNPSPIQYNTFSTHVSRGGAYLRRVALQRLNEGAAAGAPGLSAGAEAAHLRALPAHPHQHDHRDQNAHRAQGGRHQIPRIRVRGRRHPANHLLRDPAGEEHGAHQIHYLRDPTQEQ